MLFFYEWNIAPKKQKTWGFIESLPLSLLQRYAIRVLLPMLISFVIIFFLTYYKTGDSENFFNSISDATRISSIFALSSILAASMAGFFAWIILIYIATFIFHSFFLNELALLLITVFYSYYLISEKRVSKVKFVMLPLIVSISVLFSGSMLRFKIFEFSLSLPFRSAQVQAARFLIKEKAFVGKQISTEWHWNNNIFTDPFRVVIPSRYDDQLLEKIENVVLAERECTELCFALADLVSIYSQSWNKERLEKQLNSSKLVEQVYALEVLDGSVQVLFLPRIIELAKSSNEEISGMALSILKKWGDIDMFRFQTNPVF